MDRQTDGWRQPQPQGDLWGEQMRKQREGQGRGGSGSLTKQLYRKDVEGRGERRRQRKRVKRGRGLGRVPLPPCHPLFSVGGAAGPPSAHHPWGGSQGPPSRMPVLARGAAEGLAGVPYAPQNTTLTFASFFLELEGVGGFFLDLMAGSLVLWGHRSAVRGDPPLLTSAAPQHGSRPSCPYLSRGLCPAGWQFSSSPQSCPAKG